MSATDRVLAVGISSHAVLTWYASFQVTAGGPWLRYVDPWATSGALFAGANGGFGVVAYPPTTQVRLEANAGVSATTSFALIEIVRG